MLALMVLSVGVAFASDDASDVIAADDEIIADEPLAVQDVDAVSADADSQVVGADESKITITPENLDQYIKPSGIIKENVTATEFDFVGRFDNLNFSIDRPLIVTGGENTTFVNPEIEITSSNVTFSGISISQSNAINAIFVGGEEENPISDVTISNVFVGFEDMGEAPEAIALHVVNTDNFKLIQSLFTYVGHTNGYYPNNVIRISNSKNAVVSSNIISASMPSAPVGWSEEPAGSGHYVSAPISEAIVFKDSDGATLENNEINLLFTDVTGDYDTIYVVDFTNCSGASVIGNVINGTGNSYIYGIILSGDNFTIENNNISTEGNYYANGIDIEGPATGDVVNNTIDVKAVSSVYGIYSGMNGQDTYVKYDGNIITGEAYNAFGMSLGDVNSTVTDSEIMMVGNYSTGIAYRGYNFEAERNRIILTSSEQGNESIWEDFGVEAVGIKVYKGEFYIQNNTIATPGKGILLEGPLTAGYINNNFINVVANEDKDAYAIYANELYYLFVYRNEIDYQGATQGTGINNAVYVNNITEPVVSLNKFTLDLVSAYIPWVEEPAGSKNYVAFPVSEGIVIKDSDKAVFYDNEINVVYGDVVGDYDTIYTVDFKNCNNATILCNDINATGNSYIYGIVITGDNFTIEKNTITATGDYYANGIDIEGPASGIVIKNNIDVKANTSVYAIYSGMNGQETNVRYDGNNITGEAYNVFGMSLGDVESTILESEIMLTGNYTTGIAYRGSNLDAERNLIVLISSEQGNESIWEGFGVETVGIKVIKGAATIYSNTIATQGKGISLTGEETGAFLNANFINVVGNEDKDAYAIYADDISDLFITFNEIDYQGATQGTGINNALYVNNVANAGIGENKFTLDLVSAYIPWVEEPAGSGNWVAFPVSEGIVIKDSSDVEFTLNEINVTYGDIVGAYDTIYAVDFINSNNAGITENVINANGYTYIYGIKISGDNFDIAENNITSTGVYYANGIDIEGPASGVIQDNGIIAKATNLSYPIYSGMNGQKVSVNYTGNDLVGEAYLVIGMSLGDVESNIKDSGIDVKGNYTTGIAYRGNKLTVDNTQILSNGSNVGDLDVWEAFGVDTIGIKVVQGTSAITNNNVVTTGEHPIDVKGTEASVHDNNLEGTKFIGDEGVANAQKSEVYNNTPEIGNKTQTEMVITLIYDGGNGTILGTLKDTNGSYLEDVVEYTINGIPHTVKTDKDGYFSIDDVNGTEVAITYPENSFYKGSTVTLALNAVPKVRDSTVIVGSDFTSYAIEYKAGERGQNFTTQLVDSNGNPLANKTVLIGVNGVMREKTTDENGFTSLQINFKDANRLTFAVSFLGDDDYNATMSVYLITIVKKPVTMTAPAKTYKATAKTKKYTVTLKTIKGASADGKTYFAAGKKVTMKINGKTYTAKTNAKGQATFSLKITKKGKFASVIKYAGDTTYNAVTKKPKITIK